MAYCTKEEVKQRLNITGSGDDSLIWQLTDVASAWIDAHCMQPVGAFAVSTDSTRYYTAEALMDDGMILRLDTPLLSITTLINGDGTTLPIGAYRLYPRNSEQKWLLCLLSGYSWQFAIDGEISITGPWGWSAIPPKPVQEASIMLAAWFYKRYQAALQDATVNLELGQLVYSKAIPDQVTALLAPFRAYGKML